MKTLKIGVFIMFTFLSIQTFYAQESETLKKKETINSSKKKYTTVKHDGVNYYIIEGLWHTKMNNRFVLKPAPKGAKINFLPKGNKVVTMAGKKYYKCKGVFYREDGKGNYEVTRL